MISIPNTNVISKLTKPLQNQTVVTKIFQIQKQSVLSSVTWGEALYGVKRMPECKRKEFQNIQEISNLMIENWFGE